MKGVPGGNHCLPEVNALADIMTIMFVNSNVLGRAILLLTSLIPLHYLLLCFFIIRLHNLYLQYHDVF